MRALVTGGAGFIGSHVAEALSRRGDDVLVVDNLSSGHLENIAGFDPQFVEASVNDTATIDAVFADFKPELVFHLAAQIDVRHSVDDPADDLRINAGGTIGLLDAARRTGTQRFVLASTGGAIYGEGSGRNLPLDESEECRPEAPYGLSKQTAEGYLSLYNRLYGLGTVALRLANVYGPRQDPHGEAGVVAIFGSALLDGRQPKVFGDGSQTRDYVFALDVAEAFLAAASAPAGTSDVFNIGTGVETSVIELGREIAAAAAADGFEPEFAPERAGEVMRISIDSTRARQELGWEPRHALAGGIAETVGWIRGGRS